MTILDTVSSIGLVMIIYRSAPVLCIYQYRYWSVVMIIAMMHINTDQWLLSYQYHGLLTFVYFQELISLSICWFNNSQVEATGSCCICILCSLFCVNAELSLKWNCMMLESSCILSSGSLDAKKIAGLLTQCWYNAHTKLAVVLNYIELYLF